MQTTGRYADFSIKARCSVPEKIESKLDELNARFVGEDHQTDTYYHVPIGKLKMRRGNIENFLTHYLREPDGEKLKTRVFLYEQNPPESLLNQYIRSREIGKVVKRRKIYWIGNVKFHVDRFDHDRSFVEIEAIDVDGSLGDDTIRQQAENYIALLSIRDEDIIRESYIDML
jgi:adenylate cyclase, class 2